MRLSTTKLNTLSSAAKQFLGSGAALNLDFANSTVLDPRVTFSRGSNATYVDSTGNLAYAPSNLLTYSEQFDNAAWSKARASVTANSIAAPNNTLTADTLVEDTTASNTHLAFSSSITASAGTIYTYTIYAKAAGRNWLNIQIGTGTEAYGSLVPFCFFNVTDGSIGTFANCTGIATLVGDGWYRCVLTAIATTVASTTNMRLKLAESSTSDSYTGDGVSGLYIWGAQLNLDGLQPYNSTTVKNLLGYTQEFENAAWTKSNSFIQTNLLTYSEQFDNAAWTKSNSFIQTNQIRNNTMVGAVAGTPGTLPTNWGIGGVGLGTVTQQIVGTGTSNGITYIDIKFSGTTSTVNFNIGFETTTQIAALSGQTWTESAYVAIVGGSITNITNLRFLLEGRNSGGTTVESFLSAGIQGSLTSVLQRFTLTSTFADATTAFARPTLRFDFSSGVSIDITLRIGLPQLVQGAIAGDVVKTYGTALPVMYLAPDGSLTADKLVETTATGVHYIRQFPNPIGPTCFSVYAKAAERTAVSLDMFDATNGARRVEFNLSTGAIIATLGAGVTSSIVSMGSGWYRCSMVVPSAAAGGDTKVQLYNGGVSWAGDGTSGVYIWGAQLVQGTTSGDYQATTTTTLPVMYLAPDGSLTADKLVETTATGQHRIFLGTSPTTNPAATHTFSFYAKAAELTTVYVGMVEGNTFGRGGNAIFNLSTGTVISAGSGSGGATGGSASIVSVGGGWFRCAYTLTLGGSDTRIFTDINLRSSGMINYTGNGTSGIYIWGAQLSDSASLDPYVYNFAAAPAAAAYYGPRFDHNPSTLAPLGLLIEEQRTNSIRNSVGVGAVVGTPGTLPTNWNGDFAGNGGLSSNVTSVAVVNGISTLSVNATGTTSGTGASILLFEGVTTIAASPGQVWAGSCFLALTGGSFANVDTCDLSLREYDAGGLFLRQTLQNIKTLTNSTTRVVVSATLGASTAFVSLGVRPNYSSGVAVNFTLRIGLPQLELGATATSVIPTTTAAATRATDTAAMQGANFSNWYNPVEGTVVAIGQMLSVSGPVSRSIFDITDGSTVNRINGRLFTAGTGDAATVRSGGVTQFQLASANNTTTAVKTFAIAYKASDFAVTSNGSVPITQASGAVAVGVNQLQLGGAVGSLEILCGYLRRIAYYPSRLSDTNLTKLTK